MDAWRALSAAPDKLRIALPCVSVFLFVRRNVFVAYAAAGLRVFGNLKHLSAIFFAAAGALGDLAAAENDTLRYSFSVCIIIVYLNILNNSTAV